MHVGTQQGDSEEMLRAFAAFGVNHICGSLPSKTLDDAWTVEALSKRRDRAQAHGVSLDMLPLPMSSSEISSAEMPAIMLGTNPGSRPQHRRHLHDDPQLRPRRDHAGQIQLHAARRRPHRQRARARHRRYSQFVYAGAKPDPPLTIAGPLNADTYWERITYFLERVVPVAEEYKVRLGCHPQDPGLPKGSGWRGVDAVLASPDGLKKFIAIKESPYHGLNFCQGTVSEQLENPGEQIFDVIRYFGSRKKIFSVHFRNIEGRVLDFRETFIDNGSVDMLQAMRVYKEVGYDGMLMPDHVPSIPGIDSMTGFVFAFGYIKALLAAVSAES